MQCKTDFSVCTASWRLAWMISCKVTISQNMPRCQVGLSKVFCRAFRSVYTAQQLESICTFLMENNIPYKIKCAPHPCRWLLTLRRIPARGSVLHVAFGRVFPGTNRGITVSFACCRHGKRQKECQGHFTFWITQKSKAPLAGCTTIWYNSGLYSGLYVRNRRSHHIILP